MTNNEEQIFVVTLDVEESQVRHWFDLAIREGVFSPSFDYGIPPTEFGMPVRVALRSSNAKDFFVAGSLTERIDAMKKKCP